MTWNLAEAKNRLTEVVNWPSPKGLRRSPGEMTPSS